MGEGEGEGTRGWRAGIEQTHTQNSLSNNSIDKRRIFLLIGTPTHTDTSTDLNFSVLPFSPVYIVYYTHTHTYTTHNSHDISYLYHIIILLLLFNCMFNCERENPHKEQHSQQTSNGRPKMDILNTHTNPFILPNAPELQKQIFARENFPNTNIIQTKWYKMTHTHTKTENTVF